MLPFSVCDVADVVRACSSVRIFCRGSLSSSKTKFMKEQGALLRVVASAHALLRLSFPAAAAVQGGESAVMVYGWVRLGYICGNDRRDHQVGST